MRWIIYLSRLWIAVVVLALWSVGCVTGPSLDRGKGREMKVGDSSDRQVVEWLKAVPFTSLDNHHLDEPKTEGLGYEAWVQAGREIEGGEAVLQKLLRTADGRVDLPQVAYALGWLGGTCSVPVLIEALDSDDVRVRIEAAASLGRLGHSMAIEALCESVYNDPDHNVRANACVALGMIGHTRSERCLQHALEDRSEFVASLAREALDGMK
ncbi:MAG: HEAT repeat domain-containing protein [Phycisphaerae bacterium]|nr:HEAT repeat domain-containing protein [Phycisphaerae bacterium]